MRGRAAARSEAEQPQRVPGTTVPVTVEQLGRLVTDAVTRIQLPKAIERFNAGQSLSFGPLMVDQIPNYFVFDVLVRAILARRQPAR